MAEAKKSAEKKSKKSNKSSKYDTKGERLERKTNFCPKCGAGIFMAGHKDRNTCGKCGFTQWKTEEKK